MKPLIVTYFNQQPIPKQCGKHYELYSLPHLFVIDPVGGENSCDGIN